MSERDIDEAILAIALKTMGAPPGPLGFEFARALWQAALATRGPIGAVEPNVQPFKKGDMVRQHHTADLGFDDAIVTSAHPNGTLDVMLNSGGTRGWIASMCELRPKPEPATMELTEAMIDRGAREGYAVQCKTNGPRTLLKYASDEVMRYEHENARVIITAALAARDLKDPT